MATKELRLVLTVKDFDRATAFFRDALGLPQVAGWENDGGHAVLFDAGRATLEIFDEAQARAMTRSRSGSGSPARSGWLSSGALRKVAGDLAAAVRGFSVSSSFSRNSSISWRRSRHPLT